MLSVSLLLVSCGGNGSDTVTADSECTTLPPNNTTAMPNVTTVTPDVTANIPDNTSEMSNGTTSEPDFTTSSPEDTTKPAPGSQWGAAVDIPTYVCFGNEKVDIRDFDRVGSIYVVDFIIFDDVDELVNFMKRYSNSFIIQFTPTSDYRLTEGGRTDRDLMIDGVIDKIYHGAESCGIAEGNTLTLTYENTGLRTSKNGSGYELVLQGSDPEQGMVLFRKGYSYFVCGFMKEDGKYCPSGFQDVCEYSSLEDQKEFMDALNWKYDISADLIYSIFERYPMVESKHKWE